VVKKAVYIDKEEVIVFFVRGNDELQEVKALNSCGALDLADASLEEIENVGLKAGFIGPIGLECVKFYIDFELKEAKNLICGANEVDYHHVGVEMFNFKEERYADLVAVKAGDRCVCCGGELGVTKGIEVGHIFQLGQKYAKAMGATFLDKNGKAQPFYMGCYGIGVSRLVAVMIEASHDEKGCIWNKQTAPYLLDIIVSNVKDEAQNAYAEEIYTALKKERLSVLLDDRNERFGFKMKDYELIGLPYALIVGKELEEGFVEIVERKTLEKTVVKKEVALATLKELLS
jgi:prolyl-tRNA synthetase